VSRPIALLVACGIAALDLLPVALLVKQAATPERESLAWPPTWLPHDVTLENVRTAAATAELGYGLALSAGVAATTVGLTLALALPAAWVAARRRRVGRELDAVVTFARVLPSVALAIPLAALFAGVGLYNHPAGLGLCLAHTLLALPVAFLVLRAGFLGVPEELEQAARIDGARAARVFWRVSLPLVRPSLGAAALLVFLLSWDEFAYALLLQVTSRSLPPLLYYFVAFGHPGLASATAVLLLAPAVLIVLLLEPVLRTGVLAGSGR
jgi:multiple sugar transport system permease protein